MRLAGPEEVRKALEGLDPIPLIEDGFAAYSRGEVVVPPVGELVFDRPRGDVHIKYGYIKGDAFYVVKLASGFYEADGGRSLSDGMMLLFDLGTGEPRAVLHDRCLLTNVRTAAAGAVAAKYLAPGRVIRAGILGAGAQGRLQLEYLRRVREFRDALVWGQTEAELAAYKADMEPLGFSVATTLDPAEVAAACNVIVTCTPSTEPLLRLRDIRPGTHITAVGSDTAEKQELDEAILASADRVVVDSLSQSEHRGEVYRAVKAGVLGRAKLAELGAVIMDPALRRASEAEVTVADLTGVAVQDIQIAKAVLRALP